MTALSAALLAMSQQERDALREEIDRVNEAVKRAGAQGGRAKPAPVVRMPEGVGEDEVSRMRDTLASRRIG